MYSHPTADMGLRFFVGPRSTVLKRSAGALRSRPINLLVKAVSFITDGRSATDINTAVMGFMSRQPISCLKRRQTLRSRTSPRTIGIWDGIGTMASYARPNNPFHFFEINPDVIDVAQRNFSFLKR